MVVETTVHITLTCVPPPQGAWTAVFARTWQRSAKKYKGAYIEPFGNIVRSRRYTTARSGRSCGKRRTAWPVGVGAVTAAMRWELAPGLPFGPGPGVHGQHTKANALDLDIPLSWVEVRTWKANLGFSVVARFWSVPYNCVAQLISSVAVPVF